MQNDILSKGLVGIQRVVVGGHGAFQDYPYLRQTMNNVYRNIGRLFLVITSGQTGADLMVRNWAREQEIPIHIISPKWAMYPQDADKIVAKEMMDFACVPGASKALLLVFTHLGKYDSAETLLEQAMNRKIRYRIQQNSLGE